MTTVQDKRNGFRQLHESGFFVLPNAWDRGSAVRLTKLGFKAIASTSAGAAWALGKQDGELSLGDVLDHLAQLVAATDLPINADFENGFADRPDQLAANVSEVIATGIAGLSIEDWSGTALYDADLAGDRIAAARVAIDAVDPTVLLVGRSENFRVPGMSASQSIARAVHYAEAGADCLFVPMIVDPGAIRELVAAVAPKPVSVLLPAITADLRQFADLGVRRCSTGGLLASAAWAAFDAAARTLSDGDVAA
ncbi:isocitrate lyase/phosphoenolpyruvate mutase family protein [Novosphingobium sp. 9U]|uniref:isocitrate lyase/PEP mutase family protein n=1 Tax=Novosphingobium sp. 9U TaxID=2653158 RepID=UPI0012F17D1D|nr:isocitrate lyase/phosphoenolpyruvate mutase family protein [Novosphingobium sp. 9U]VWX48775.1 2-methylisocitrate lyase [Novosphingobium sp. 9U]